MAETNRIDELLQEAVASGAVPGAVAVVVDRAGEQQVSAAGRLSVDGGEDVRPGTLFRLASMTKAVATVAVLQLVEQGRVDLDAEVRSYVPEFGALQLLEGFDGDEPRLRAPASHATVRQLLSHTAGLGYPFLHEDLKRWYELSGNPGLFALTSDFLDAPLVADPGTRWEYGTNVDWAGRIVETVSGTTLGAYLDEHVLGPLEMRDTTFRLDPARAGEVMPIHARTPDGGLVATDIAFPPEPEMHCGGHGLYGTAPDYGRFVRMILRGGELDGARILDEATVDLALSPQLGALVLPDVIRSTDPAMSNDIPSLPVRQSWGLGFHLVLEDLPGMRHAGTGDWAGLTNCYYWIDRASGVGGVFLTQVLPFFDEQIIATLMAVEAAVYAEVAVA